jgi:hypothetical protein
MTVAGLFLLVFAGLFSSRIYKDRGGDRMVVDSTGVLNIENGGRLVIKGDTVDTYLSGMQSPGTDSLLIFGSVELAALSPIDSMSTPIFASIYAVVTTAGYPNAKIIRAYAVDDDSVYVHMDMNPDDSVRVSLLFLR